MTGYGDLALVSGALQLTIPSYSLRLVRRFGTRRVGWFLVTAFASLASLHLLRPLGSMESGPGGTLTLDAVFAIAATLLFIGLCHLETLLTARQACEHDKAQCESRVGQKAAELSRAKQELARQSARLEQAESELRQSLADYCFLFEQHPQPMWIFDLRSLRLMAGNRAALGQFGFSASDFKRLTTRDLLAPAAVTRFVKDAARPCSGLQSRGVWPHRRKDGSLVDVELAALDLRFAGAPARLILAGDTTPRGHREQECCEAQKHELVCRLAAGVAHHFNNTLSIISGYASLLEDRAQDPKTTAELAKISSAVACAAGLSRQLLITSGQFALRLELLDLNGLITNLGPMVQRLVGKEIKVRQCCASNLPPIHADSRMVEHILVNLVLNARDAMSCGGVLTVSTAFAPAAGCGSERNPSSDARASVCLSVRDTGCGMTPDVEAHLFEPFFTTHEVGKGRGLGLASVQGALKQQEGWIEYTTEPGVGTEFRAFLPVAPSAPAVEEPDSRTWFRQ